MMNKLASILAVFVASAALLWFGTGLHPVWCLMWIAPLPLLWRAPRMSATHAFIVATLAWLVGALNEWSYIRGVGLPVFAALLITTVPSLAFGIAVVLWRRLLLRGALLQAALAFSATMVAFGFALQRLSVHSTWGSLAYTQMDFLPILQTAALAGVSGIVFVVTFVPTALAAATWGSARVRHRAAIAGSAVALFAGLASWGAWRVSIETGPQVTVGLISSGLDERISPKDVEKQKALFAGYSRNASDLIARGAQLVIVPEKIARVVDDGIADVDVLFQQAAARGVVIAAGVERWSGADKFNESRLYGPGTLLATYEKHHMLPPFESNLKVGTTRTVLNQPSGKWGVAICKDMDFPLLSREYGGDGIGLMVVPAWDFDTDGWLHGRMAIMRGVESGFSVARSAKRGALTLSDSRGRVTAEVSTGGQDFSTLLGRVPTRHVDTLYVRWGDWFSWLMLGVLALTSFSAAVPRTN